MTLELTIKSRVDLTPTIRQFTLVQSMGEALPPYSAGAHIEFDLGNAGKRSYSLIDWQLPVPSPTQYTVAVQREDKGDGGSIAMHNLTVGQVVSTSTPENDFELSEHSEPVVLLAGGIGVTPIVSMACALRDQGKTFHCHYTGRSAQVMAYADQLNDALGGSLSLYTDDASPLNLDALLASIDKQSHIYICGPTGMIEATRAKAEATGIANDNVHVEVFCSPDEQSGDKAFEVEISSTGQVHIVPPGKSIIDVLEAAGIDLMFDCQRGDCGICQTDVLSGTPDHRDFVLSQSERDSGKVMQICVSRALSDRLVLDL